jgi:hypothetical protein
LSAPVAEARRNRVVWVLPWEHTVDRSASAIAVQVAARLTTGPVLSLSVQSSCGPLGQIQVLCASGNWLTDTAAVLRSSATLYVGTSMHPPSNGGRPEGSVTTLCPCRAVTLSTIVRHRCWTGRACPDRR